jgi:hypothetical protein
MSNHQENPLVKHFRQPAIYIKLPSQGKYWPEGDLEIPANGELPIYPMTTRDEITLKTPDALLNGAGVVAVIESCCPNIKNAWHSPSIDLDAILIGIRIASYGHEMSTETACPKCSESNNYDIDLRTALDSVKSPDYSDPLTIEDLRIHIKPQNFQTSNRASMLNFEEQKILQAINNENISDEQKAITVTAQLHKVIDITSEILSESTDRIEMADGTLVKNKDHIREYYQNAKSSVTRALQKRLEDLAEQAALTPYSVACSSCDHKFSMAVDFNYSSFFAVGS